MLTLPDIISDEITENFSKEDVRALSAELKEENEITDLEVMMEETDQTQEELPSILEQTAYQLGKDQPQIYIDLFETLYINESQAAAEILAPDEEKIYSLRIPGTGRILLSLKLSEQQVRLINVRSQEKRISPGSSLRRHLENLWISQTDQRNPGKNSTEKNFQEKSRRKSNQIRNSPKSKRQRNRKRRSQKE